MSEKPTIEQLLDACEKPNCCACGWPWDAKAMVCGGCGFEPLAELSELRERLAAAERENITLRMAMGDVATNLGNGAAAAPNCTLEFLAECVPNEVKLVCADLRQRLAIAESTSKLHYDRETEMIRRATRAEADGAAIRAAAETCRDSILHNRYQMAEEFDGHPELTNSVLGVFDDTIGAALASDHPGADLLARATAAEAVVEAARKYRSLTYDHRPCAAALSAALATYDARVQEKAS